MFGEYSVQKILLVMVFSITIFVCSGVVAVPNEADVKTLSKQLHDKDESISYAATAKLAAYYRQSGDLGKAASLTKKFTVPKGCDQMPPTTAVEYVRCVLEAAHVLVLKDKLPEALPLLHWAETRPQDFERAVASLKYAEILVEVKEGERAEAYLNTLNGICAKYITSDDSGTAVGQAGSNLDTQSAWRNLTAQGDLLRANIEQLKLQAKFGKPYADYVKLRRLMTLVKSAKSKKSYDQTMNLCNELTKADRDGLFAAAAGYLRGQLLLNEPGKTEKEQIGNAKKELEKFVKANPDGAYRGEALLLLGKISLEKEWNAKDAEKFYFLALEYFQKSREKRNALSLYANMKDDLKKQIEPKEKLTSLDQWKRIVYHDEDPLRLYSTASAPEWYVSEQEKNCIFALGFLAFADGKYDVAQSYWSKILSYSPDIAALDPRLPNVQSRLLKACRLQAMAFWPEEKNGIKDRNTRLKIQYAEYLILTEHHADAIKRFKAIAENSDDLPKAVCYIGIATATDLEFKNGCKPISERYCQWILNQKKLQKEPIYGKAIIFSGDLKMSRNDMEDEALPFFLRYVETFNNGRDIDRAKYRLAQCYLT